VSTIDEIIARLHQPGAERLVLVSGKQPVLTANGESAPIGEEIDRVGVEGMILLMGDDAEPGQRQFLYETPGGVVEVTARITERLIQVIIVHASREALAETISVEAPVAAEPEELAFAGPEAASTFDPASNGSGTEPPVDEGSFDAQQNYAFGVEVQQFGPEPESAEREAEWFDPSVLSADFEGATPPEGFQATAEATAGDLVLEGLPLLDAEPDSRVVEPVQLVSDLAPPDAHLPSVDEAPSADEAPRQALESREDAPAMERLFLKMVEGGCSDLHVSAGSAPLFRKDGRITDLGGEPVLSPRDSESLLMGITPERFRKQFEERHDTDFAYEIPGVSRFRCNLFRDRKGAGGVFRQIPTEILTAQDLGLQPRLLELCQLKKGLILVTGPTGSGKSTTLAALIDHINRTREDHIITIEDPIEFVHENRKCLINQREVGEHTASFKVALRAALREDPDIVLVGELRDLETVEIALETAETGHLVFATLHTNTAPGTVSRLIDQFPSGQQAQIRTMLADTLKAVVAQTLCRKKAGGRIAALEVLMVNNAVANLIREDKAFQIPSAMQTGKSQGMNTLNDALLDLVQQGVVEAQEAYWNAVDKSEFETILSRNGIEIPGTTRDVA